MSTVIFSFKSGNIYFVLLVATHIVYDISSNEANELFEVEVDNYYN
ncbi:hypothetical protein AA0119_g13337 [Alternaria tenuissima]|jgi:hypothetical protein|uniref:Uncharacterized protein n=2 Tax=Alternaria alternata complex TaxID=187734 RepID=A0A4Q4MSP1_ALTAL|nr:hypothetical protein AA0115_g12916 [Alternaria tenuissima]RYN58822.1 hypothetical protein AA0117_g13150 [Alternaria alternata]RYN21463.1 hypothetical protein AA0114_g12943 [Alternaria tenuissima]RYN85170.1 hypothetical protein AA0119_g13337 [Alternaria tenuissima]RYO02883.1 hypothetical protein AA0121_g13186 [Alternaria tenuissima]